MATKQKARLQLTTQLKEAATVDIDGQIYEIFGADHISPEQEVELISLYKRYERLERQLETTEKTDEIKKIAKKLQGLRFEMITEFTSIPEEVLRDIKLPGQVQLLNIIGTEMGISADASEPGDDSNES